MLEHLRQRRDGVAAAELAPVIDRIGALDRCIDAIEHGTPIEACPLEDLDPLDQPTAEAS